LPIYGKEWVRYYKGKRLGLLSPHVYAIAEATFSSMIQNGKNQSVLVRYVWVVSNATNNAVSWKWLWRALLRLMITHLYVSLSVGLYDCGL
jgi:hypothetical protein